MLKSIGNPFASRLIRQSIFGLCVLVSGLLPKISDAHNFSDKTKLLRKAVDAYTYSNKYDSAQILVMRFLDQKDLSPEEIFYGHFLFGDILKASGKPESAIPMLLESKRYLSKVRNIKIFESLIYGNVAECYFDVMNYNEARKYALLSIQTSPDSSMRGSGHAVNYMMLGYAAYVSKDFPMALTYYRNALDKYRQSNEPCELPLCYTKMARVYNSSGDQKKADEYIRLALTVSDSCKIENYKLITLRTSFEIDKENKNYKQALDKLTRINDMVAKMGLARQAELMNAMSMKYQLMIGNREIANLKRINEANFKSLSDQRIRLYITVGATVILSFLIFFLIRMFIQKEKAQQKLSLLNAGLEQKIQERTSELNEDIRIREKLETQLNEKIKDLETLISKISHDIRSPLATVSGLINVAEMQDDTSETKIYYDKIRESVSKLDNILIDLTSTVYVSTMKSAPENIRFDVLIPEIMSTLQSEKNYPNIRFDIRVDQDRDFLSDKKFIQSILQNLISNSIKYAGNTDPFTEIHVSTDQRGVTIRVKDNGIGIDKEFHEQVFNMFFRATTMSKGSGLGLYIVKTAVEKLRGHVTLESEKRRGSTFTVFLPDSSAT